MPLIRIKLFSDYQQYYQLRRKIEMADTVRELREAMAELIDLLNSIEYAGDVDE